MPVSKIPISVKGGGDRTLLHSLYEEVDIYKYKYFNNLFTF